MKKSIFILFLFTLPQSGKLSAQVKYERESRMRPQDVPSEARSFLASIETDHKIRWYREEKWEGASIEAKFRYAGADYSVEFDTTGMVEDVERTIRWKDLPLPVSRSISDRLDKDCRRYKVVKIQRQYTGMNPEAFSIRDADNNASLVIRYELVVRCKRDHAGLYEYLFDRTGELVTVSQIVFRNSSHLEY